MKTLLIAAIASFSLYAQGMQIPEGIPDTPTEYPDGMVGEMVKLGEDIMNNTNTHPLTKDYVGNDLTCTNCHLQAGKTKSLGTFIGTATVFPSGGPREESVQTLQDRINNCFMRSMNGKRPIVDTKASIAMATYVTWLSQGLPLQFNTDKPVNPYYTDLWPSDKFDEKIKNATHENYKRGEKLYNQKCASCHAKDGQGVGTFPAMWGSKSYNTGAGLSKLNKMATWMQYNMPLGNANLTDQETVDITIYVNAQPRDDFDLQDHLLPRKEMGHYNSNVSQETHSVRSNFKNWGLDIDKIRGDSKID